MNEICALILVGGKGKRLESLTKKTSKPYVSFMGKYRIIDFPLSSLSHSGVRDIGIITQYEPYDLMKYIGNGRDFDLDIFNKGVALLTPYTKDNNEIIMQKGTAHAVKTQIDFLKNSDSEYVLILSGDQIYKIDFSDVLENHIKNKADLTILTKELKEKKDLSRYGVLTFDKNHRINSFVEKPKNPKSSFISMGIYLFSKSFLSKYLNLTDNLTDFGHDLIPYLLEKSSNIYAYEYDGLFFDVGTIKSLYDANMYFLDNPLVLSPHGDNLKVYSKPLDYPPHFIAKGAKISESVVSDGSIVEGTIKHSVLSYRDKIMKNAIVEDSVVLPNVTIEEDSIIKNAIVSENLIIKKGSKLIFNEPTLIDLKFEEVEPNEQ